MPFLSIIVWLILLCVGVAFLVWAVDQIPDATAGKFKGLIKALIFIAAALVVFSWIFGYAPHPLWR